MHKPDAYNGFLMVPKLMDLFSFRNKDRKILDIGAGTGLVAKEVYMVKVFHYYHIILVKKSWI